MLVSRRIVCIALALPLVGLGCQPGPGDGDSGDDADSVADSKSDTDEGNSSEIDPNDPCKPGGEPSLVLGEGEVGFFPFDDGANLELIYGSQGGVHTFMALEASNIDASEDLVGKFRGYIDGEQIGAAFPYLHFRCKPADGDEPAALQVWGVFLIWDAPPENLHLQPVHIEVEITDATGLVLTTSKDAVIYDPTQA